MRTLLAAIPLLLLGTTAAQAATPLRAPQPLRVTQLQDPLGYPVRARIWVENDRDYYRPGDHLDIRFVTSADAYVAIVHIDPDGYLDFLYPRSPFDDEYVRGGREYSVSRGFSRGALVRGTGGIGYLYILASPVPLDYRDFRRAGGWDWSYAGRSVRGDPFWAFEQITRRLLPDWNYVPYASDYYSYYVGRNRVRYPSYACRDGWSRSGWGWSPYASSCSRLQIFLRDRPWYFDTHRYRGDRRREFRDYSVYDRDPRFQRHGYKESPEESRRVPTGNRWQGRDHRPAMPQADQPRSRTPAATPSRRSGNGNRAPQAEPRREPARPVLERRRPAPRPEPRRPTAEPSRRPSRPTPAPRPTPQRTHDDGNRGSGGGHAPSAPRARPHGDGH
ncbi:MAG TPA: DUF4384 domain-containing protein [Longimicrobiaceae bacterium]|nr:DUF4384 domain-containing protein [Longimicrobiaceae bacterium]